MNNDAPLYAMSVFVEDEGGERKRVGGGCAEKDSRTTRESARPERYIAFSVLAYKVIEIELVRFFK